VFIVPPVRCLETDGKKTVGQKTGRSA